MTDGPEDRPDSHQLLDRLEEYLLGEEPALTGEQVADDVGIEFDAARQRWRSLGFSAVDKDVPAFTHADVDALRLTEELSDLGFVEPADEQALIRSLGRSFARLAEWQMGLLAKQIDLDTMSLEEISEVMARLVPAVESLQSYVWRRHTLAAASRLLLAAEREDTGGDEPDGEAEGELHGVGFADIVNYTRQSRSLSRSELTALIDDFEARALEIVTAHDGRIVKTIGDEVLFVADEPAQIARIGLELVEERTRNEHFPELRVGLAWGPVVARLGDVLGPVVNVASRLTSTSRPGRVLVDRALADELKDDDHLELRKLRRTTVKGYRRLEPWSLRRPAGEEPGAPRAERTGAHRVQQRRQDVCHLLDEVDPGGEGPPVGEGGEQRPGGHRAGPVLGADEDHRSHVLRGGVVVGARRLEHLLDGACCTRQEDHPAARHRQQDVLPDGVAEVLRDRRAERVRRLVAVVPGGDAEGAPESGRSRTASSATSAHAVTSSSNPGTEPIARTTPSRTSVGSTARRAPRLTASMAPGPPPLATVSPWAARSCPRTAAWRYAGSVRRSSWPPMTPTIGRSRVSSSRASSIELSWSATASRSRRSRGPVEPDALAHA